MQYEFINALDLKNMFLVGAKNLDKNKALVDTLNVFPVPDGDTGTNMSLTVLSVVREVNKIDDLNMLSLMKTIANGALMGARGNSGVILSQLFRGFCQVIQNKEEIDAVTLADAFQNSVDIAYKAVIKPVEGTILTVAKGAAKGAKEATETEDCYKVLVSALESAEIALNKTKEMLPALAQADVVDAGGKGFCLILEGFVKGLTRDEIISNEEINDIEETDFSNNYFDNEAEIKYQYCTELFIRGKDILVDALRKNLESWGDSLIVVGSDELIKIHIHTNTPDKVLQLGLSLGSLHDIKIENMKEQHENKLKKDNISAPKDVGIVSVCVGEGLVNILHDAGVDHVISGGQTMNPSTEDLVEGIRKVNAKTVYVLPNNKNIILAAKQAKEVLDNIEVIVIPSKSFPQGMAALLNFDLNRSTAENTEEMLAALSQVSSGEITYAVRDTKIDDLEIKSGEYLGLAEGKIVVKGPEVDDVLYDLITTLSSKGGEFLSVYYGMDVTEEELESLKNELHNKFADYEIEFYYGGQPLYFYIISLE